MRVTYRQMLAFVLLRVALARILHVKHALPPVRAPMICMIAPDVTEPERE